MNNTFNSNNTSKSINIENINFAYEDKIVFENYSQRFPIGETSVIMAPSGFGKTTLLYMIAGLISPTNGNINIPINNPKFSFAFQDLRLIESLNVKKNITLVNSNISTNDLDKCLEALAIKDLADKKVSALSGGEKSRVSIARALMADYDILLLDEPFNGLDDTTKDNVIKYIKEKTAHKTVLLVTHNKDEADYFR
ncbi:MAG: ATP-binding cassette domain-containing protein [Lachnospiraceae bacterium]|nr:ATP-binding cassette domain-containing protein [Lachnospiraceae bacterium]